MTEPDPPKVDSNVIPHAAKPSIESLIQQLAGAITNTRAEPQAGVDKVALRADYQTAVDMVKVLTDIRFRCLVFVTAVITVANALLPGTGDPVTRLMLGIVGFVATLGIAIYELRNSQLYESAIHRAKVLEDRLQLLPSTQIVHGGGLFTERPPYVEKSYWKDLTAEQRKQVVSDKSVRFMKFWFVPVKHDHGLALIYGVALGGWIYLITDGLLALSPPAAMWQPAPPGWTRVIAGSVGVVGFMVSVFWFVYHDRHRFQHSAPSDAPQENPVKSA